MNLQQAIELASACGLAINGWTDDPSNDDGDAVVAGPDVNYIGTKEECVAYMTAWQQCMQLKLAAQIKEDYNHAVKRGIMALRSSNACTPGGSITVFSRPQASVFRGDRIAIPDNICRHWDINDIRVGNVSTFIQSQTLSAQLFACRLSESLAGLMSKSLGSPILIDIEFVATKEFGKSWSFPPCQVAQDLVISATNISDSFQPFEAYILGKLTELD